MDNIKSLEKEVRLMAYYKMRNHLGAMALGNENDKFYHLLYEKISINKEISMKKDYDRKLTSSIVDAWSSK